MKTIKLTSQFKKDLKRYQNNPRKMVGLERVVKLLRESGTVPNEYKPHFLAGNYKGFMECHIENDFLLIWYDEKAEIIKLVRLGSHSELFKK